MEPETDIRYCVSAYFDLMGFSSHLEVGNDLRTNIGKEAINRLRNLEKVMQLIKDEKAALPDFYPHFNIQRINDALILVMDLPSNLTPNKGKIKKNTLDHEDLKDIIDEDGLTEEEVYEKYHKLISKYASDLIKFIGLCARIHLYINEVESANFSPGVKTTISSGFRYNFINQNNEPDYLSANFSFSNAYLAQEKIKGTGFFIDNSLIQILCANKFCQNLFRRAVFIPQEHLFDPLKEYKDILFTDNEYKESVLIEVMHFRKIYVYREINSLILSYFQIVVQLESGLSENPKKTKKGIYASIRRNITDKAKLDEVRKSPLNGLGLLVPSLGSEITLAEYVEIIITGDSNSYNERKEAQRFKNIVTSKPPKNKKSSK
ncbi:MAG: hypothetical protein V4590_11620 [Bacteroidota bacterium]